MRKKMQKELRRIDPFGLAILGVYILFISWRLFFYAYSDNFRSEMSSISYNLIPLKTIAAYLYNSKHIDFDVWIYNLAGNIAAFMPLGFFLPAAFKGLSSKRVMFFSVIFITSAEVLQLISRRGVFDVDDLLLNSLGCALGLGLFRLAGKVLKRGAL